MRKLFQSDDKYGVTISVTVMAVSALLFFFHVLFFEDILDDLTYRCILTPEHPFANTIGAEKVTSLADAIKSQCNAWHDHNGRFFIHTITQMFAAVWGREAFSVFSALVVFVIELMLWFNLMYRNNRYPIVWAVTVCVCYLPFMLHR